MNNRIFWGIMLLLLGVVLIFNNLGLFGSFDVWKVIGPLFLIGLGVWIVVRPLLRRGELETEKVALSLENASRANLRLDFGGGRLTVNGGAAPGQFLEGECSGGVRVTSRHDGELLRAHLEIPSRVIAWWDFSPQGWQWDLNLSDTAPMDIEIHSGASESRLDLSSLKVQNLHLETGASSTDILLPAHAGHTHVRISSGAASVTVRVPEGVAGRIRAQGGLAAINVNTGRFPRQEGVYQSADYETAANRVEISIETGVGAVDVI